MVSGTGSSSARRFVSREWKQERAGASRGHHSRVAPAPLGRAIVRRTPRVVTAQRSTVRRGAAQSPRSATVKDRLLGSSRNSVLKPVDTLFSSGKSTTVGDLRSEKYVCDGVVAHWWG